MITRLSTSIAQEMAANIMQKASLVKGGKIVFLSQDSSQTFTL